MTLPVANTQDLTRLLLWCRHDPASRCRDAHTRTPTERESDGRNAMQHLRRQCVLYFSV